jgi:hypothetical protein
MSTELDEAQQRRAGGRWRAVIVGFVVLAAGLGMVIWGVVSYPSDAFTGDPGGSAFAAIFGLILSLIGLVTTIAGVRLARRSGV